MVVIKNLQKENENLKNELNIKNDEIAKLKKYSKKKKMN